MNRILDQLKRSRTVLVVSHVHPDGDAIGALLAIGLVLQTMQKSVCLYNESPIPAVYRFLPSVDAIVRHLESPETFDTVVVLDCGDLERIGKAAKILHPHSVIINIDHHVTNTQFGHLHLIEPEACATAELVYRVIRALPVSIDSAVASAIYTGILTDTGSFRFSNTNQKAFAICAEMIQHGANAYEVAQHVYGTYSLGRIKLLNLALDSLEISPNGRLSIMTLTQRMLRETGTQSEDIDGFINYARRIEEVKVAALIHETRTVEPIEPTGNTSRYHVSLRSDGGVDVSQIAAQFGGGGHVGAAGFSIETTLPQLKSQIIALSETIPALCTPS
jgi:bifunctional oligoribonuclease and PAP phosphatase NrnA